MTLNDIMAIAEEGYAPKEQLFSGYWDFPNEKAFRGEDGNVIVEPEDGRQDGLARFLVLELSETYDEDSTSEEQLAEAIRVIEQAQNQCASSVTALWLHTEEGKEHAAMMEREA